MDAIGKYVAWQLCAEIWKENRGKWYTLNGFQCWRCWRASQRTPADRLVSRQDGYRGCAQVNQRYDHQHA